MADKKITELTNITGANLVDADEFVVVDISADETKAITLGELKEAFDSGSGFVRITGDTMTGALDVQSTITADGLTLDAANSEAIIGSNASYQGKIKYNDGLGEFEFRNTYDTTFRGYAFYRGSTDKTSLRLDGNGDISFYEDTGTTPKFFWDASAERLGVGTTTPNAPVDSQLSGGGGLPVSSGTAQTYGSLRVGATSFNTILDMGSAGASGAWLQASDKTALGTNYPLLLNPNGGNVGIGTTSPSAKLDLQGTAAGNEMLEITHSGASQPWKFISGENGVTNEAFIIDRGASGEWLRFHAGLGTVFSYDNTERMRIDSSGNVGIGETSPSAKLDINQSSAATGLEVYVNDTGSSKIADLKGYDNTLGVVSRMAVQANGNVGIGTSSPSRQLTLYGTVPYMALQNATTGTTTGDGFQIQMVGADAYIWNYENSFTAFGTSNTERMRIDSSGNVGIGTTDVKGKLQIGSGNGGGYAPTGHELVFGANNSDITFLSDNSGTSVDGSIGAWNTVYNHQNSKIVFDKPLANIGQLLFYTNNGSGITERMRLDASGNLLVGASAILNGSKMLVDFSAGGRGIAVVAASNANGSQAMHFYAGSTQVGNISVTTSATSYATSSDYRLKTDAQPMTGASARVQALNPVNFQWIADGSRVDGFLAHEAQEVVPEAVTGTKDAMRDEEYEVTPAVLDDDGNVVTEAVMGTRSVPDYQGIDQSKLVPLLTAALQEALTKIDALETRITALEG